MHPVRIHQMGKMVPHGGSAGRVRAGLHVNPNLALQPSGVFEPPLPALHGQLTQPPHRCPSQPCPLPFWSVLLLWTEQPRPGQVTCLLTTGRPWPSGYTPSSVSWRRTDWLTRPAALSSRPPALPSPPLPVPTPCLSFRSRGDGPPAGKPHGQPGPVRP